MQINEGLSALLTLLMEDSWHPDSMPAHTKRTSLWHVREYLDQNYAQKISLDDLAERYFINKYYHGQSATDTTHPNPNGLKKYIAPRIASFLEKIIK